MKQKWREYRLKVRSKFNSLFSADEIKYEEKITEAEWWGYVGSIFVFFIIFFAIFFRWVFLKLKKLEIK